MPLLYLDPGTGSLLLYAIVGITTTVLFALRGFWYSLRGKGIVLGIIVPVVRDYNYCRVVIESSAL